MDKEKFEEATLRIFNLIKAKSHVVNLVTFDNEAKEISKALNEFIDNYIERQIVQAAREIVTAAVDDIAEKPTPAGQYVSDIKFNLDGSAIVYYNGDTAGKRYLISARYEIEDKD